MVKFVEFRSRTEDGWEPVARFVWPGSGPVQIVGLEPGGWDAGFDRVKNGIVKYNGENPGGAVFLQDGEAFIDNLTENFRGSYFWATAVKTADVRELPRLLTPHPDD